MKLPALHALLLANGIQTEPLGNRCRIVFWLPAFEPGPRNHWLRIQCLTENDIACEQGVFAIAANAVPTQRQTQRLLAAVWRAFRKDSQRAIWFLPTGDAMEQAGERRTDLLLAWAADDTISLDHARIREKWPDCQEIRVLAKNLFLVVGVKLPVSARVAPSVPHEITPCALATRLLAEARQQGELSSEVAALLDMGIVVRREGNAGRAATLLEQALELARRRGNAAQEMDVLSNLGPAYLSLGNARQALNAFTAEEEIAREIGSHFAMQTALTHLGMAFIDMGNGVRAITYFESALNLAREAGDRQAQHELEWSLAEQHAELGNRDKAVAHGLAAVEILRAMNKPEARVYAEYLEKYRDSAEGMGWVEAGGGYSGGAGTNVVGTPGLLRMALTVAKALTKHVASGLKTVSGDVYQRRLQTCGTCEHYTGVRCRVCGCFAQIKARLPNEQCPLEKWPD